MAQSAGELLANCSIIPVIVINEQEDAVPLAKALVAGGLDVLEITLRSEHALNAITRIKKALPNTIVGAGTVLNTDNFSAAQNAGADFIVSPGSSASLVEYALTQSTPFLPGVATASEAMVALDAGFTFQKFFPAEAAGGIKMLKALHGPLPHVQFCPTGGINSGNAQAYLALPNVACVGGTWMLDTDLIRNKKWDEISQATKSNFF